MLFTRLQHQYRRDGGIRNNQFYRTIPYLPILLSTNQQVIPARNTTDAHVQDTNDRDYPYQMICSDKVPLIALKTFAYYTLFETVPPNNSSPTAVPKASGPPVPHWTRPPMLPISPPVHHLVACCVCCLQPERLKNCCLVG
jgi:hypothetical protein